MHTGTRDGQRKEAASRAAVGMARRHAGVLPPCAAKLIGGGCAQSCERYTQGELRGVHRLEDVQISCLYARAQTGEIGAISTALGTS